MGLQGRGGIAERLVAQLPIEEDMTSLGRVYFAGETRSPAEPVVQVDFPRLNILLDGPATVGSSSYRQEYRARHGSPGAGRYRRAPGRAIALLNRWCRLIFPV
jgi:hypothetical protein